MLPAVWGLLQLSGGSRQSFRFVFKNQSRQPKIRAAVVRNQWLVFPYCKAVPGLPASCWGMDTVPFGQIMECAKRFPPFGPVRESAYSRQLAWFVRHWKRNTHLTHLPHMASGQSVVIVGAGMAGLLCGRIAATEGFPVTVVDKGSRPGGRMATRPLDGALADYGAQFMEARSQEFRRHLQEWQGAGLARLWGFGFEGEPEPSGLARYLVDGGMNRLPAHLSESLEVRVRTEVESITTSNGRWVLRLKEGQFLKADAVVLTCPVPQALHLLRQGAVELDRGLAKRLDTVLYDPCFTLILHLAGESGLPCPGALSVESGPLAWLADNQQKGISGESTTVTIHASPEFSASHFDDDRDRVMRLMEQAAAHLLATPVVSRHLHRWRYARVRTPLPERVVVLCEQPLLLLAGDACGGRDVEAAALSGMAAAEQLRNSLREGVQVAH